MHMLNSNHRKVKVSMASYKYIDYIQWAEVLIFSKIARLSGSPFQKRRSGCGLGFQNQEVSCLSLSTKKEAGKRGREGEGGRLDARQNTRAFLNTSYRNWPL